MLSSKLLKKQTFTAASRSLAGVEARRFGSSMAMPDFDYVPPKYTGPSFEEMTAKREEFVSPACFKFYRAPLMIVDGKM